MKGRDAKEIGKLSDLIHDEFVLINIQYDNKLNLYNCFA